MINIKTLLIFITFLFILSGCSEDSPHVGKWSYGQTKGWYPLKLRGQPVYLDSEQAYINAKSLVVNCAGKGIKIGHELFVFMDDQDNAMLYDNVKGKIIEIDPPTEVFETNTRALQTGDALHVDQLLRGSGKDTQNQCGSTEHQYRRFSTPIL